MKSLSKEQFKEYVIKKAKEYLMNEGVEKPKDAIELNENDDVTPDAVKQFVLNLKNTNDKLSFQRPLMESEREETSEEVRTFQVGSYENVSIDLKDTLMETMYNYNRKKSLTHGKESAATAWERLVDYKKFEEE